MYLVLKKLFSLFIYSLALMGGPIFLSHSTAKQCAEDDKTCKDTKTGFLITGIIWLIVGLIVSYVLLFFGFN
jgi:hypothetical protein